MRFYFQRNFFCYLFTIMQILIVFRFIFGSVECYFALHLKNLLCDSLQVLIVSFARSNNKVENIDSLIDHL